MRLELEQAVPRVLEDLTGISSTNLSTGADEIIKQGIVFARAGDRLQARSLLMRAVEVEPDSEKAWMWLASTSEYPEELLVFLDHVLLINAENQRALEWKQATELLLAKTFVSRGIEAAKAGTKESAIQFFHEALKYDEQNQTAWSWLKTLNNSDVLPELAEEKPESDDIPTEVITDQKPAVGTPKPYSPPHSESVVLHPIPTSVVDDDGPTQELVLPESLLLSDSFGSISVEIPQPSAELTWENSKWDSSTPIFEPQTDFVVESPAFSEPQRAPVPADPTEQDCDIQEVLNALENDTFVEDTPVFSEAQEFAPPPQWYAPTMDSRDEVRGYIDEAICPFCKCGVGDSPVICENCDAMLTMSDMEALLAYSPSKSTAIQRAVRELEDGWGSRGLNNDSLCNLAIGYLNLGRMDDAYCCLREASSADPNNVVIANYLNTLAIRIDEIRQRQERTAEVPVGKAILVVDDSPTIRKLISSKLEKSGHQVFCAEDGVEAIEMLTAVNPDLVLLDISMPRMDGYEVCKTIRSQEATRHIPVVMISGKDGFFDKVRGKMAGSTDYITKPFGPEALMKALGKYLHADVDDAGFDE